MKRFLRHLLYLPSLTRKVASPAAIEKFNEAVRLSESKHSGEVRIIVEGALSPQEIFEGKSSRDRAVELFSQYGIWDTENNNGVLIYLLIGDRKLEIVADRGINRHVSDARWSEISCSMEALLRGRDFEQAILEGIRLVTEELVAYFPVSSTDRNELSDSTIILR